MRPACRKGSQEFTLHNKKNQYPSTLINAPVSFEQWI